MRGDGIGETWPRKLGNAAIFQLFQCEVPELPRVGGKRFGQWSKWTLLWQMKIFQKKMYFFHYVQHKHDHFLVHVCIFHTCRFWTTKLHNLKLATNHILLPSNVTTVSCKSKSCVWHHLRPPEFVPKFNAHQTVVYRREEL